VYDNIGNRLSALEGTAEESPSSYTANNLNQYTQRAVSDAIEVMGSVNTGTTVTVNNMAATRQGDHYWYKDLEVTNSSSPVYEGVSVVGVYNPPGTNDPDVVTVESGKVFVAQTPESFTYDDDGNLTSDGRWQYTWDCENRLVQVETAEAVTNLVPRKKLVFEYDYMGRRVSKAVYVWDESFWATNDIRQFVYDGWLLVSEICNLQSVVTTNHYVWGLDLSGSLSGAGGIGGLLACHRDEGSGAEVHYYFADANGNVGQLVDDSGTDILAHYEYAPFGKAIVASGTMAGENVFRFSTKYMDFELGTYYYGHRSYHPETGRWLSRDPIWDIKPSVSIGQRPRWIRDPKALKLSRVSTL